MSKSNVSLNNNLAINIITSGNAEDNAKYSRIIQRKQLDKRIQGLKEQEYTKIYKNLTLQNNKLKQQVTQLNKKVQQLMQARKMNKKDKNKNPEIQQQILKHKRELQIKYESMNLLKEQIKKITKNDLSEDMKLRLLQYENQMSLIDRELTLLKKEKKKALEILEANNEEIHQYQPNQSQLQQKLQAFRKQNKQLKNEVMLKNNFLKTEQKKSKTAINAYYDLKNEQQNLLKSALQSRNKKRDKYPTLNEIKQMGVNELQILEKEVEQLRKKKKQAEKDLVNEKIIKQAKKSKLEKEIRDSLEYHKQLNRRRIKSLNQLNLFEKRESQLKQLQQKQVVKQSIETIDNSCQTDKIFQRDYRKDWIGQSSGHTFDDGKYMDYKSQVLIKSVTTYKNSNSIVFLKFSYQSPGKKKYQTEVPFDQTVLRKCQMKKIVGRNNSFLKNLKASLTNNSITKVNLVWSDGEISEIGWQAQNSIKYQFDISSNERPICMFGSVSQTGKSIFALESIGCQILDSQD